MDSNLRPIRGAMCLHMDIADTASAADVLMAGVRKLSAHNQHFIQHHPPPHELLYHDGSVVNELPERNGLFTVRAYKQQTCKEYGNIKLYVVSKSHLGLFFS